MPVEMTGINPTQVRFTKKGNAYLNSNAGKAIGAGVMLGQTVYRVASSNYTKNLKKSFAKATKHFDKKQMLLAKTGVAAGILGATIINVALGLGLGSIVDACINKINANKTDKDMKKFNEELMADYMLNQPECNDENLSEEEL